MPPPSSPSPNQIPGILLVLSSPLPHTPSTPTPVPVLTDSTFDTWYTTEHIPTVISTSGISGAARYEFIPDGSSPARDLNFLTCYEMPDLGFMQAAEFRNLEGQSEGPARERIFEKARFDTRAYEEIGRVETEGKSGLGKLLLFAALSHSSPNELDDWYKGEHVAEIAKCPGHVRTRRFKLHSRSILSGFVRSFPEREPQWLALHEFEGPELPWESLKATDETDWAKKVLPGLTAIDFGVFRLTGTFEKTGQKSRL